MSLLLLFQGSGAPPPPDPSTDIGKSAALILSAVGLSAGASLLITGKGAFVQLAEVDLAVSALVGLAVDATRLLIVSVGDGWTGASAARNV